MEKRTEIEQRAQRSYFREFSPAVAGYVVSLMAITLFVDFDTAGWWKYPVALVPAIPAAWGAVAVARHLGRVDEMQRRILVDGMALGFGVAMIAAVTVGFLGMAGLATGQWGPWVIYSVGMLAWGLAASRSALGN